MANICEYKMIVKGKKNACYAFFGSMAVYDDKTIERESGTADDYELLMHGYCKWDVDSYCKTDYDGECPVKLPDDPYEAMQEGVDKYLYYTVQEHSRMFDVEVQCCYADIDEAMGDSYEHYKSGVAITEVGGCPKELFILVEIRRLLQRIVSGDGDEVLAEVMDGYNEE